MSDLSDGMMTGERMRKLSLSKLFPIPVRKVVLVFCWQELT